MSQIKNRFCFPERLYLHPTVWYISDGSLHESAELKAYSVYLHITTWSLVSTLCIPHTIFPVLLKSMWRISWLRVCYIEILKTIYQTSLVFILISSWISSPNNPVLSKSASQVNGHPLDWKKNFEISFENLNNHNWSLSLL